MSRPDGDCGTSFVRPAEGRYSSGADLPIGRTVTSSSINIPCPFCCCNDVKCTRTAEQITTVLISSNGGYQKEEFTAFAAAVRVVLLRLGDTLACWRVNSRAKRRTSASGISLAMPIESFVGRDS